MGQRWADRVANVGGSWSFITWFTVVFVVWILSNSVFLVTRPFLSLPIYGLGFRLVLSGGDSSSGDHDEPSMIRSPRPSACDARLSGEPLGGTGNSWQESEYQSSPIAPMGKIGRDSGNPDGADQRGARPQVRGEPRPVTFSWGKTGAFYSGSSGIK